MKFINWFLGLLGNNPKAKVLIFAFIAILVLLAYRCSAQVGVNLAAGASFGCLEQAPVLALDLRAPFAEGFGWNVGTTLWGAASGVRNNWDWHARAEFSRWNFGAGIGMAYLQNIDAVNGSHAEFSLELFWRPWRVGADAIHLSNAGTTQVNCGRNAGMLDVKLR